MLTPITWMLDRFGFLTTVKLTLMAATIAGCLGAATLNSAAPAPAPTRLDRCTVTVTVDVSTAATTRQVTC